MNEEENKPIDKINTDAAVENPAAEDPIAAELEAATDFESADTEGGKDADTFDGDLNNSAADLFSVIEDQIPAPVGEDVEDVKYTEKEDTEEDVISLSEENETVQNVSSLFPEEQTETEPTKEKAKKAVGKRTIDTLFDFVELFIFTLVAVLIATTFIFRHSVVSGESMMNTLNNGDKLIISNLFYEPEYMDIVVVEDYSCGMTIPIVKRVIATEGQTVRISKSGISVDGFFLNEDDYIWTEGQKYEYKLDPSPFLDNETLKIKRGEYIEFTVPEDEVFVLGDHRNDSKDSRFYGTIREDAILGKVIFRISPFTLFN